MIASEVKNSHLIKLLLFNHFLNRKFLPVLIVLLSLLSTSNDQAVNLVWGEPEGYFLGVTVFSLWVLIYCAVAIGFLFIGYFLNASLRGALGRYTFEITDEGVLEKSKLGEQLMSWGSIVKVHRRADSVYIERSGDHWSILLKEGNEGEFDGFVDRLLGKLTS